MIYIALHFVDSNSLCFELFDVPFVVLLDVCILCVMQKASSHISENPLR